MGQRVKALVVTLVQWLRILNLAATEAPDLNKEKSHARADNL